MPMRHKPRSVPERPFYTTGPVATLLRGSLRTIQHHIQPGRVPAVRGVVTTPITQATLNGLMQPKTEAPPSCEDPSSQHNPVPGYKQSGSTSRLRYEPLTPEVVP